MIKPTKFTARSLEDIAAMMRLYDSKDGRALVEAIKAQVAKFDVEARTEDDPIRVRWLQGAAQALSSLADAVENARTALKSFEENTAKAKSMQELNRSSMIG